MKIRIFTILTILLLSFGVQAQQTPPTAKTIKELQQQAKTFKNGKRYGIVYDKFEDRSLVRFSGFDLIGFGESIVSGMAGGRNSVAPTLTMGAGFVFSGEALNEEPKDYFIYFDYSGNEWQFLRSSKLIALVQDGDKKEERIQFGEGETRRDIERRGVSETVGFKTTKEQLTKLSGAKYAAIKIADIVKPLKPEHLQMFADIVKLGDVSLKAETKK